MNFNYKYSYISHNLWIIISQILIYSKGIILLPILIKNIGVNLYGGYSILLIFSSLIYGISSLGVGFKYQRYFPSANLREKKRDLFYKQFLFQILSILFICLLLILTSKEIKNIFFKNEANFSIYFICGLLFSNFYFSQVSNYFRYTNRMRIYSIVTTAYAYLNVSLLIIGIIYFRLIELDYFLILNIISMVLVSIPYSPIIISEIGFKLPRLKFNEIWEDMKLGTPILFSYLLDFILAGSDRFLIALYMNLTQVGFYNPAYILGSIIILIPKAMGVALPPMLSKAVDEGKEIIAISMLNKSLKFYLSVAIPFIIGTYILSYDLLLLLTNKQVADNSYFVTPIVSMGILFYGLTIIISEGIAFVKLQTKLIFYSNIVASVLSILLNIIILLFLKSLLVPATVTLIAYLVSFIFIYVKTKKLMQVSFDKKFIGKIITASILMGLIVFILKEYIFSKIEFLIIALPVVLAIYFIILIFFKAFEKEEVIFIKNYILSIIKK